MAGRPKEFDPDDALARAVDVFWRQGYEATGVQDLLDAMGINRGSMYDTFGCKRELFLKAMAYYGETFGGPLAEALDGPGPPLDNLRAMFRGMEANLFDPTHEACPGCLITNTAIEMAHRDAEVAAALRTHLAGVEKAFVRVLRRAADTGDIPADAPVKRLAAFLTTIVHGTVVSAKAGATRASVRAVVDIAVNAVTRGGV